MPLYHTWRSVELTKYEVLPDTAYILQLFDKWLTFIPDTIDFLTMPVIILFGEYIVLQVNL